MLSGRTRWSAALLLIASVAAIGYWTVDRSTVQAAAQTNRAEQATKLREANAAAYDVSLAFGRAAEYAMPAVVNIMVAKKEEMPSMPQFQLWFWLWPSRFCSLLARLCLCS